MNKIFVVSLMGGLGNNLHQIALAKHLENVGHQAMFEVSSLRNFRPSIFKYFYIEEYLRTRIINESRFWPSGHGRFPKLAKIVRQHCGVQNLVINWNATGQIDSTNIPSSLLTGYWQRLEYASHLASDFRKFYSNKLDFHQVPSIRIHIRRQDMIRTESRTNENFFRTALLSARRTHGNLPVEVISDDPGYCKRELNLGTSFVTRVSGSAIGDLGLLVESQVLILSRSTFSWWSAYLSDADVFCPTPWFPTNQNLDKVIIPKNWNSIWAE